MEELKIAIDADSMFDKAIAREPDKDIEYQYMELLSQIGAVKTAFHRRFIGKTKRQMKIKLAVTPRTTFRNEIYPSYKAKRKKRSQEKSKLMNLAMKRLGQIFVYGKNVEADDIVIALARHHGYMVAAIDKDVRKVCPTTLFNYGNYQWAEGVSDFNAELAVVSQAIEGDPTDGIPGAKGKGQAWTTKNIVETHGLSWNKFVDQFKSEDEAITMMRLVRMDQLDHNMNLHLWTKYMWKLY